MQPWLPVTISASAVAQSLRPCLSSQRPDDLRWARTVSAPTPASGGDLVGAKRRRLENRLVCLTQLFGWGELSGEDYRREMADTHSMLAELPDPNKLVAFDRNRRMMVTMAENVDRATRPQLAELVQLLVEGITAVGRTVDPESIVWTPPAVLRGRCVGVAPHPRTPNADAGRKSTGSRTGSGDAPRGRHHVSGVSVRVQPRLPARAVRPASAPCRRPAPCRR
jgi:hypothetical protein